MKLFLKGLSTLSTRAVYMIYVFFASILVVDYFSDTQKYNYTMIVTGVVSLCTIGFYVLRKSSLYLEKLNEKKCFFVLVMICLAVKLMWVLTYKIQPLVDYATFYYTAEALSKEFVIDNNYIALFPHVFGYASFLSIFLKIFGASHMVAPIINVVLTTISMGLIYVISRKIGGVRTAITASVLWIVLPSQTIYNMFALSEPLYCTILLLIWAVMISVHEKIHNISIKKLLVYSILLAALLALMNMVRPIAAVPIIALVIWLFIINTKHIGNKKILLHKVVYLGVIIIGYVIFSSAINQYITLRLGEEIASAPGYNIYVGFNQEHSGKWNMPDAELLFEYNNKPGWTAEDAQQKMLEEAKNRILSDNIDFMKLFSDKFFVFLSEDSAAVSYAEPVLDNVVRYTVASNIFYYFLIVTSILGILIMIKNKTKSILFMICLYTIGLTIAQLLVEVASRYHYSATIPMIILAAFGINYAYNKKENIDINKKA
ncbi:glycosyltransferase family 39 protein [Bacillus thuringiensis]|uniref:Glycosyltransferase family 39 protein n=1 Tax=Bacillus thuringiensis serovar andalousiensis TaxID=257985 RepID=A0A6H0TN24_BACTU|nr:glycosyltransferase family 39 protein [Bacillus thuringiensis]QIW21054.1 glycosyltransferase family 39 protein [Bacillus thuringiensis serovar andalousiensis]